MGQSVTGRKTQGQVTVSREQMGQCLEQAFFSGKEVSLLVSGYSMSPTLRHGKDRVFLVSPVNMKIRRLDIVLFQRKDGKYLLHRIIRCKSKNYYVLNGDAQTWTEEIDRGQIKAVVKAIDRSGRIIDSNSPIYSFYAFLWVLLKPVRGIGIYIYHLIGKYFGTKR